MRQNTGFTLVELLIVVGVLAVLGTATVAILNPVELSAQGRDSARLSDVSVLNNVLYLYSFDQSGASMGAVNTVYISIPDASSICAGITGLPSLPSGWVYHCSPSSSFRNNNGTGWIPVDFTLITKGAPLVALPTDPTNVASSRSYYIYVTSGSQWEVATSMESQRYKLGGSSDATSTDGGSALSLYEAGNNKKLLTGDYGDPSLVGYWPFEEGTGTIAGDASGNGNNGSPATIDWTSSGCKVGGCVTATNGYSSIVLNSPTFSNIHSNVTVSHWIEVNTAIPVSNWPYSADSNSHISYGYRSSSNGTGWMFEYGRDYPTCSGTTYTNTGAYTLGLSTWHLLTTTYDGNVVKTYVDGAPWSQANFSTGFCSVTSQFYIANTPGSPGSYSVDDVRIYSRALSAAEVMAIYNATK